MFYQHNIYTITRVLLLAMMTFVLFSGNVALADGPVVSVAAPSQNIGDLGAALGNVWDMDSTGDIRWKQPNASGQTVQYAVRQPGDSDYPAQSYGRVLRGETPEGSDLVTAFYADANVSIPSDVYHHLLYRLWVAHHQPGEAGPESTNGRILYSPVWPSSDSQWYWVAYPQRRYSKGYLMCTYGDWCLYYVDLSRSDIGASSNPWQWGQPGASVKAFGIWPHENWGDPSYHDTPEYFYLDYVYLTGDIVAGFPAYTYTVRWNVADTHSGVITSTLYYQEQNELQLSPPTCDASLTNWTPITDATTITTTVSALPAMPNHVFLPIIMGAGTSFGSGVIGPYNSSFRWDLSSDSSYTAGKVYYVCVVAQDNAGNKSYRASSAPVIKVRPSSL